MCNLTVYEIMVSKYGYLMLPRAFPDKVIIPDFDFTDEVLVQCYITVVKNTYAGAGNLQIITNKFSWEYLWHWGLMYYCFWTQFCI